MASSSTQIVNLALSRIGQKPITSLEADTNNAALLARLIYDDTRRAVLRIIPWKFALRDAELAELADVTSRKYDHVYQLPTKALYVVETSMDDDGAGGTGEAWDVQGRTIITDAGSPIEITYIEDTEDTIQFDSMFVDLLAEKLAAELVYGITKQAAQRERLLQSYGAKAENAAAVDGQQGSQQVIESNQLITARA
jgi:hypothetical protein